VAQNFDIKSYVTDKETVSRLIPGRKADSNKGDYGRVLVITGSTGMTGAGCLAGTASLRSGTGLCISVFQRLCPLYMSVI